MRDIYEIKGLQETRTMHSIVKRSIPRMQSSIYLDLYVLKKEKERLEKEDSRLDMRKKNIKKRLDEIILEMEKLGGLEKEGHSTNDAGIRVENAKKGDLKKEKKEWKTMTLNY